MLTRKHRGKCFNRSPLSPTHSLRSCNGAGRTFQVVTLVLILVFARTFPENAVLSVLILALVFSALRIYAVWERNIILSLLILALDLVPFGMNLVRVPPYFISNPFLTATQSLYSVLSFFAIGAPYNECVGSDPRSISLDLKYAPFSVVCEALADKLQA